MSKNLGLSSTRIEYTSLRRPVSFSFTSDNYSKRCSQGDTLKHSKMSYSNQASSERVQLPGFGLPLEQKSILPTATESWFVVPTMVRERVMIGLMGTLKDKPDWERKVFNDEIVSKWRAEALHFGKTMSANIRDENEASPNNYNGDEGEDEDDDSPRNLENSENIEFDGSARQKQISRKMFDYASNLTKNQQTRFLTDPLLVYS